MNDIIQQEKCNHERQFQLLLMLYPKAVEDIAEMQRRQWNVVYYALLLIAAVVGVFMNYTNSNCNSEARITSVLLQLLVILIVIASVAFLMDLHCSVVKVRKSLITMRALYPTAFEGFTPLGARYDSFFKHWKVVCLFLFAIWVGWELAAYVLGGGFWLYLPLILPAISLSLLLNKELQLRAESLIARWSTSSSPPA
jgi:hypothetical protein